MDPGWIDHCVLIPRSSLPSGVDAFSGYKQIKSLLKLLYAPLCHGDECIKNAWMDEWVSNAYLSILANTSYLNVNPKCEMLRLKAPCFVLICRFALECSISPSICFKQGIKMMWISSDINSMSQSLAVCTDRLPEL
ncbi:hypothetical protein UY3_17307 [Chelonia mydas]|uniref:Uncharacterized protein n=1 Tax=Chelonia mydas TaxID=8469 RepID=M7BBK9_CHEMY|nr:hypothetical protein UY3_17307 [Chelonia mydas]